jgi:hypothetical protein
MGIFLSSFTTGSWFAPQAAVSLLGDFSIEGGLPGAERRWSVIQPGRRRRVLMSRKAKYLVPFSKA